MKKVNKRRFPDWRGFEELEPRLLLSGANDLTVAFGALPGDIPTGYALKVPIQVTNNEASSISGTLTLTIAFNDGSGFVTLASKAFTGSIGAGDTANFKVSSTIPTNAAIGSDTLQVTAVAGSLTSNTPLTSPATITWDFGNIAGLGNVSCTAVDPDSGNTGTFSLTGPGMGSLSDPNTIWDMALPGSTRATKVAVAGAVDLEAITAETSVGSISAPQTDFTADTASPALEADSFMNFAGGLLSLTMNNTSVAVTTDHTITVGSDDLATDALAMTFNNVNDLAVNSMMPISSFTAASVTTVVGNPEIQTAAYIGSVTITGTGSITGIIGTSAPEIYANAAAPATGLGIASVKIGGNMEYATIDAAGGGIGPVTVGGNIDNQSDVETSAGNIGNVKVTGNVDNSSNVETTYGNIGTVTIGGNLDHQSNVEVNDAGNIGAVTIGGNLDNSAEVYIGENGSIASVTVTGSVQDGAKVYIDNRGNIGAVKIKQNLGNDGGTSEIYDDYGNIKSVTVGVNMDEGEIYADYGDIGPVTVTGSLLDESYIETDGTAGNIASVTIGGSLGDDNGWSEIETDYGSIGTVKVGTDLNEGEIYTDYGDIGAVTIGGSVLNGGEIETSDAGNIASVKIGDNFGDGNGYAYIESGSHGSVGPVTVTGAMNDAYIYTAYGDIASLTVGEGMTNGSYVETRDYGNIGSVKVGGNFDDSEIYTDSYGNIGTVAIKGDFSGNGYVYTDYGNIGMVSVGQDMTGSGGSDSYIEIGTYGNLGGVTVGGKMDHAEIYNDNHGSVLSVKVGGNVTDGSDIYAEYGDLGNVTIGGDLDGSYVYVNDQGNIGKVAISGNFDDNAEIYNYYGNIAGLNVGESMETGAEIYDEYGATGIGSVSIGQDLGINTEIYTYDSGSIGSLTVKGNITGTSGNSATITGVAGIGSVSVSGYATYANISSGASMGAVSFGGLLQNSTIEDTNGGAIASVKCAELDGTIIATGATPSAITTPTDARSDFFTQNSYLGSLTVTGISGNFMIDNSEVLAWNIGSALFKASSVGSGTIEYHTLGMSTHLPSDMFINQVA